VDELAITVVGHDRAGIIADVAEILAQISLNLTDSTMTRLRGHFAMTLVCAGRTDPAAVEAALTPLAAAGELAVTVRPLRPEAGPASGGVRHVLNVHGADRMGIVAGITRVIADFGGNITDLTTRLVDELYVLVAEVDLPSTVDAKTVGAALRDAAGALGVEASLRPVETDLL
jgi:glycine cleavage system transcriptional repressor